MSGLKGDVPHMYEQDEEKMGKLHNVILYASLKHRVDTYDRCPTWSGRGRFF